MNARSSARPLTHDTAKKVAELVGEFYEERAREKATRKERISKKARRRIASASLLALGAFVWFVPVSRADDGPLQSAEREQAGRKVQTMLAATRIRDFRARHGRLPRTLAEAGVRTPDLTYTRESTDAFTIRNGSGASTLVFRSTVPDSVFVGNAFRVLETKS